MAILVFPFSPITVFVVLVIVAYMLSELNGHRIPLLNHMYNS